MWLDYHLSATTSAWARTRRAIAFVRRHALAIVGIGVACIAAATTRSVMREIAADEAQNRQDLLRAAGVERWDGRIARTWSESGWSAGDSICYEFELMPQEADIFIAEATAAHREISVVTGPWPNVHWPVLRSYKSMKSLAVYRGDEYVYVGVTLDGTRAYVERRGI